MGAFTMDGCDDSTTMLPNGTSLHLRFIRVGGQRQAAGWLMARWTDTFRHPMRDRDMPGNRKTGSPSAFYVKKYLARRSRVPDHGHGTIQNARLGFCWSRAFTRCLQVSLSNKFDQQVSSSSAAFGFHTGLFNLSGWCSRPGLLGQRCHVSSFHTDLPPCWAKGQLRPLTGNK